MESWSVLLGEVAFGVRNATPSNIRVFQETMHEKRKRSASLHLKDDVEAIGGGGKWRQVEHHREQSLLQESYLAADQCEERRLSRIALSPGVARSGVGMNGVIRGFRGPPLFRFIGYAGR
jgi:hypothetical protein